MSAPKNKIPAQRRADTVACQALLLGQAGRFLWTLLEGLGKWLFLPPPHTQGYCYFILEPNKEETHLHLGSC